MPEITLRSMALADADLVLGWRNDPVTRENSRTSRAIDAVTHIQWLKERLADPRDHLYIVETDKRRLPLGSARISPDAEVSIMVAPQFRGNGIGQEILYLLSHEGNVLKLPALHAQILATNKSSLLAFIHQDYLPTEMLTTYEPKQTWVRLTRTL